MTNWDMPKVLVVVFVLVILTFITLGSIYATLLIDKNNALPLPSFITSQLRNSFGYCVDSGTVYQNTETVLKNDGCTVCVCSKRTGFKCQVNTARIECMVKAGIPPPYPTPIPPGE